MKILSNYYLLIFLIFFSSCEGQKSKNIQCNKDIAIKSILELPETKKQSKYIDSISNHKKGISIMIDSLEVKAEDYYEIKTGYNGKLHWETYNIYYVNRKNCMEILINDVTSGNIIPINDWRNKQKQNKTMENIEFYNLFNEGTIVKFTPKDLDKSTPEIQEFKRKLKLFEEQHPLVEDFDKSNLTQLINNETFFDVQYYVESSWLKYFIDKYKIDITKLNPLMSEAIKQEDYNAVKILIEKGYIVSDFEFNTIKETQEAKKENIEENRKEGFEMYLTENSKIDNISKLLKSKYLTNHIEDKDGYTNLRKEKNAKSEVLQKIKTGEQIEVLDNTDDWFLVKTKEGKTGYVHKSRIKSGNSNNHSTSFLLYDRPDFSSFSREVLAKGEVEIVNQTSGWVFVKVNGITGYLATEELKKEQQEIEKKKHTFLADEDEAKPKKKKGFWDSLFG